jgi:predicted Zn-dependent peptidase
VSEPSTKLGKRLCALMSYDVKLTDWDRAAADFANEIRGEAIPWAHKALDEVGAPKGPDLAGRISALTASRRTEAPVRLTENALNACKAFNAPTDPSDAVVYLATLLDERDAVREELRAIIVEAIKGGA